MNAFQRLFLVQARSDYEVFGLLRRQSKLPACHALHYLQMATEKLGKAHALKHGPGGKTHAALVGFLLSLITNRKAQNHLGFARQNEHWKRQIHKALSLAERIEKLAPTLAGSGPNPEYPWPEHAPTVAPAEYSFPLWNDLQKSDEGRRFLTLLDRLFTAAEAYL